MFSRILAVYTRYFALWVVLSGVLAYFWPGLFVALKGFNELFFSLTMFGIGAVLTAEDFREIAKKPGIVLVGTFAQFIIMPFGAYFFSRAFHLPAEIAAGLILTGCAPGAMSSNVMSYIAKADTAYSVSLTTVSTLLCPLLTPGLTLMLAGSRMDVKFTAMMISVINMVIIPLGVGFAVRHFFKRYVEKMTAVFPAISVTFIIFICSLVIAMNKAYLSQITGIVLIAGLALNVYGMAGGYGVASFFRMNVRRRRTLSIEIGMQNAGLGVVLAMKHFGEKAAMPAAIFVFICIITASLMAAVWQKNDAKDLCRSGG
jgi:BASS family bile acid:Na+ symporter